MASGTNGHTVGDLLGELDHQGIRLRLQWSYDPYPDLSYLEQVEEDGSPMFPDVDPNSVVSLQALLEKFCPECEQWDVVDSLGGVDFIDSDYFDVGTYAIGEAMRLSNYQGDVAVDMVYSFLLEHLR